MLIFYMLRGIDPPIYLWIESIAVVNFQKWGDRMVSMIMGEKYLLLLPSNSTVLMTKM